MANNRLYLVDQKNRTFLLAKSFGTGWELWPDNPTLMKKLQKWLEKSGDVAAQADDLATQLRVMTEAETLALRKGG